MGRPKLDYEEGPSVLVGVRMTVEMRELIDHFYAHRGNRSEAIRDIIEKDLRRMRSLERTRLAMKGKVGA